MINYSWLKGTEWKKVYSFYHPSSLGKNGFFANHADAHNKNADNETADMFSILDQLEDFRDCDGNFHFKICYPELAENFSFPCNEWIQGRNPFEDKLLRGFKPINITFQSATQDFNGLGMSARGKGDSFIDDAPFIEVLNLVSAGLACFNFKETVASDISDENQFLPPENVLISHEYLLKGTKT